MNAIEVTRLTKTFPSPKGRPPVRVVDGIDFAVREGEVLSFLGPLSCLHWPSARRGADLSEDGEMTSC